MSQQTVLTTNEQKLNDAWEEHLRAEFRAHSADEAIATMVANPLVNQVPVMIGGDGREELHEFYAKYFLPQIPPDMEMVPVSRTIQASVLVQLGLLQPEGLPVVGAEGARSVLDRSTRLNELIHRAKATSRKTAAVPQNSAAESSSGASCGASQRNESSHVESGVCFVESLTRF